MAEFLTTQGISHEIENIIKDARTTLVLISPYLRLSRILFERMKDADKRNVKIVLVYGKDELKPDERDQLRQLSNLKLYFLENLHAKCYFNQESMVIASMNLHEFSEKTNREMGVLVTYSRDKETFKKAMDEAKSIVNSSKAEQSIAKASRVEAQGVRTNGRRPTVIQQGHCIRCGAQIAYNPEAPHCYDCYREWAHYGNYDYMESFCHVCGRAALTFRDRPLCNSCYRRAMR